MEPSGSSSDEEYFYHPENLLEDSNDSGGSGDNVEYESDNDNINLQFPSGPDDVTSPKMSSLPRSLVSHGKVQGCGQNRQTGEDTFYTEQVMNLLSSVTSSLTSLSKLHVSTLSQPVGSLAVVPSPSTCESHNQLAPIGGTISRSSTKFNQVNVNLTVVNNPQALSFGGQVNVNQLGQGNQNSSQPPPAPTVVQKMRSDTERHIEKWTKGMILTQGAKNVLDKVSQGRSWITIAGNPGEGKTTAGYMVLKRLSDMGRQVYEVDTPGDYYKTKDSKECVLMLNDIFGALQFDMQKVRNWEDVFSSILRLKEHTNMDDTPDRPKRPRGVVILISRSNILKEASHHLGRFRDLILGEECVVDFTHGVQITFEERVEIWKSHAISNNVYIDTKIVNEVCLMATSHGFPHCCRLFANMYKQRSLDMKYFFSKPLEFLNQSVESLMNGTTTGMLLREMMRNNGSLDLDTVEDDERKYQYVSIVETLSGTYLIEDDGKVKFQHPSVYDSVAFVLCTKDPLYVIKHCSLAFLNERILFMDLESGQEQARKCLEIPKRHVKAFIQRLKKEIQSNNLALALSHSSLFDSGFVYDFCQCLIDSGEWKQSSESLQELIHKEDEVSRKTFLFLITRSRSDKLLKHICETVMLSKKEVADTLFGACEHIADSSVKYLLDKYGGLALNVTNDKNETPLLVAAKKRSAEMIKMLLEADSDVNKTDQHGNTALHNICTHGIDDSSVVQMVIEKGGDINQKSSSFPCLPLHIASYEGQKNVVSTLLDLGADIDSFITRGYTALTYACRMNHFEVMMILIDRGADMKNAYSYSESLIITETKAGHARIVKGLVDKGANVQSDRDNGPLYWACFNFRPDIAKILLDAGADVNKMNKADTSPFLDACSWGDEDLIKVLLENGADINKGDSFFGATPLHRVALEGHANLIKVLLSRGADVNKQDKSGRTALNGASNKASVLELLRRGANMNNADERGNTPLHTACQTRNEEVALTLLQQGADVTMRNKKGKTASDTARLWGNDHICSAFAQREGKK